MTKTSYQMLEIFSCSDRERAKPPPTEIRVLTLVVKKAQWSFPGCPLLENRRENLKLNAFLVVVLVFESKAPLFTLTVLTSISVEISRKVARARKRKINRSTITLFSWSYSYRTWLSTIQRERNRWVIEKKVENYSLLSGKQGFYPTGPWDFCLHHPEWRDISGNLKNDLTRDDSQRRLSAQQSVATLVVATLFRTATTSFQNYNAVLH